MGRLRQWLIRLLAGKDTVILNAEICTEEKAGIRLAKGRGAFVFNTTIHGAHIGIKLL